MRFPGQNARSEYKTALVNDDIAEQRDLVGRVLDVNDAPLAAARRLLDGCALVRLVAIGSSRHAAGYGAVALEAVAHQPASVPDAPGASVPAPAWRAGHVAVLVSQSGRTPALVDAAVAAKAAGAPVIAITNDDQSTLHELADVGLYCAAGPERVVAATKSVVASMILLRALAGELPPDRMARLNDAIAHALEADVGPALASAAPASVVGAGFAGGWVADEVALKFAEMVGRRVAGEPLVEHLHGPVAAGGATLVFANDDDPNLAALAGIGSASITRVGVGPNADVALVATGDVSLDPIVALIAGQRIVAAWATKLGEDPDSARGLRKVTETR